MSQMLARRRRVFLMNNVHDDGPIVFQSRWALSYLRGPLSRQQIQTLMDPCRQQWLGDGPAAAASAPAETPPTTATGTLSPPTLTSGDRPLVPHGVTERFWLPSKLPAESARLIYRPALLAKAACRYVQSAAKLDEYYERRLVVLEVDPVPDQPWRAAGELPPESLELARSPEPDFEFQSPIGRCSTTARIASGKATWSMNSIATAPCAVPLGGAAADQPPWAVRGGCAHRVVA